MAWGISPKKNVSVPLGDFGVEKYLAIVYKACENLNWKVSYVNEDGLIAYTPISWESYSEEITIRIKNNTAFIKSECVGYQGFLTDYGKNEKNLELLIAEIEYVAFHIKIDLEAGLQKFKDGFYQHPGISLDYSPIGAKAKLKHLGTLFIPTKNFQIVPSLIIINCLVYIIQRLIIYALIFAYQIKTGNNAMSVEYLVEFTNKVMMGVSRESVLNGQYWRLISACFSHGNLLHLVSNMIALAYIGSIIEGRVGKWNFLGLYLMTGICASITSIAYRYVGEGIGASGAIMGMFGIFLAYLSTSFFDKNARTALLVSTVIVVTIALIPTEEEVDHAAHFGGFISGYVLGLFSYWAYIQKEKLKRFNIRTLSYAVIIATAVITLSFIPRYDLAKYSASRNSLKGYLVEISSYFYADEYRGISREEKIILLEQKVLPLIKKTKIMAKKLAAIPLPEEEEKDAKLYAKFADLKLDMYELLYQEYKTHNPQYRIKIDALTERIGNLRSEEETD